MNGSCRLMGANNQDNFRRSVRKTCTIKALMLALVILLFLKGFDHTTVNAKTQHDSTITRNLTSLEVSNNSVIEETYPEPFYIPELRPYSIAGSLDKWHTETPSSYITPDNDWVKHIASQLYVDHDGRIYYKYKRVPWLIDGNNVLLWTNEPFTNNYVPDDQLFNKHYDEYWQNADYYLTHGRKGDCDDWAIAVTSMMLSGEMSLRDSDNFTKQKIPAKMVLGLIGGRRDAWVEYNVYGDTFITSTSLKSIPYSNEKVSSTLYTLKNSRFRPVYEMTDNYFKKV